VSECSKFKYFQRGRWIVEIHDCRSSQLTLLFLRFVFFLFSQSLLCDIIHSQSVFSHSSLPIYNSLEQQQSHSVCTYFVNKWHLVTLFTSLFPYLTRNRELYHTQSILRYLCSSHIWLLYFRHMQRAATLSSSPVHSNVYKSYREPSTITSGYRLSTAAQTREKLQPPMRTKYAFLSQLH
jgi:hypothetical protein